MIHNRNFDKRYHHWPWFALFGKSYRTGVDIVAGINHRIGWPAQGPVYTRRPSEEETRSPPCERRTLRSSRLSEKPRDANSGINEQRADAKRINAGIAQREWLQHSASASRRATRRQRQAGPHGQARGAPGKPNQ